MKHQRLVGNRGLLTLVLLVDVGISDIHCKHSTESISELEGCQKEAAQSYRGLGGQGSSIPRKGLESLDCAGCLGRAIAVIEPAGKPNANGIGVGI